MEEKNILL